MWTSRLTDALQLATHPKASVTHTLNVPYPRGAVATARGGGGCGSYQALQQAHATPMTIADMPDPCKHCPVVLALYLCTFLLSILVAH